MNEIGNLFPVRLDSIAEEELDDTLVLYDSRQETVHLLNISAETVWDLCDGQRNLSTIALMTAELFGCSAEMVRDDVSEIVQQFSENGLVNLCSATTERSPII